MSCELPYPEQVGDLHEGERGGTGRGRHSRRETRGKGFDEFDVINIATIYAAQSAMVKSEDRWPGDVVFAFASLPYVHIHLITIQPSYSHSADNTVPARTIAHNVDSRGIVQLVTLSSSRTRGSLSSLVSDPTD